MANQLSRANAQSVVQECTKLELPNLEDPSKEYYPSRDSKKPLADLEGVFYILFLSLLTLIVDEFINFIY